MGHRSSAIATRPGDGGTTGLGDGRRVSKSDPRVNAMGDIDELNSAVGLLIAFGLPPETGAEARLIQVQQDLLDLAGELNIPGSTLLNASRVAALDAWLTGLEAAMPRLQQAVRPGGAIPAAQAHMCRTICRRAERSVIALSDVQAVSPTGRQYLNRLSGVMLALARILNRHAGEAESPWTRECAA